MVSLFNVRLEKNAIKRNAKVKIEKQENHFYYNLKNKIQIVELKHNNYNILFNYKKIFFLVL